MDGRGLGSEHRTRHAPSGGGDSAAKALRGIEKAAILLVAIGEERAGEIFRYLGDNEVEALSLEIAKSRKVAERRSARDVLGEAVETVLAEDYIAEGGVDYARSILERSLGANRAEEVIGRLAATIERRPFEFLRRTPAEQIAVFLRNESPQTIALVVANLHTTLAAQVLSHARARGPGRGRPARSPGWPRRGPRSSRRSRP